jgi:hypothetical protein
MDSSSVSDFMMLCQFLSRLLRSREVSFGGCHISLRAPIALAGRRIMHVRADCESLSRTREVRNRLRKSLAGLYKATIPHILNHSFGGCRRLCAGSFGGLSRHLLANLSHRIETWRAMALLVIGTRGLQAERLKVLDTEIQNLYNRKPFA